MIPIVVWLALVATWVIVWKLTSPSPFSPSALFLYYAALKLILRPAFLVFDVTSIKAPYLYRSDLSTLLTEAMFLTIIWLVLFGAGFHALRIPATAVSRALPRVDGELKSRAWIFALIAFAIPGVIAAGGSLLQAGRLDAAVIAVREGSLDSVAFVRKIPQTALALSVIAIVYEVWNRRRSALARGDRPRLWPPSALLVIAVVTMLMSIAANLTFGDRSSLLIPVILGWIASRVINRRSVVRGLLVVTALVLVLVVLGNARNNWRAGGSGTDFSHSSPVDTFVDAVNLEGFDRLMLLLQDWKDPSTWRWGDDFIAGVQGVIPRFLWVDKPANITTGGWFHTFYTGTEGGGWPLNYWGAWYINFGPTGILLSGLLSGMLIRAVHERYRGFQRDPVCAAMMALVLFYVVPNGPVPFTPVLIVLWILPLRVLTSRLFVRPAGADDADADAPPEPAPAPAPLSPATPGGGWPAGPAAVRTQVPQPPGWCQ